MTHDPSHDAIERIITETLKGWHSETVLREVITNKSLEKIETHQANIELHLKQLNGNIIKHTEAITALEKADIRHVTECPAMPKIERIEKGLVAYNWVRNNPKTGLAIIAVAVSLLMMNYFDISPVKRRAEAVIKTQLKNYEKQELIRYEDLVIILDSLQNKKYEKIQNIKVKR